MALVDDDDLPQFEEIYTQYKQQLYGIAYKILNNEQDAEDAVQITFQNIANDFKKISQIPCNELPSCIVIICRNAALNIYRKNKKRAARSAYITDEIAAADVIKSCEDKAALMNAIRQLPDEYKDILFLFDLQGFSAKHTAKMLGIKANAVRVKSFRARKMSKDILNGGVSDD
jgi:RNA polymerase sigma-70 factor (ECF subfamily)